MDLAMRLELARQNSQNQHNKQVPALPVEKPVEETIYEGKLCSSFKCVGLLNSCCGPEDPPPPVRPPSRSARDSRSHHSTAPSTPTKVMDTSHHTRSSSQHSSERRPLGPRCPSPLPQSPQKPSTNLPSMEIDLSFETTLVDGTHASTPSRHEDATSPLPRSKRQPFVPTGNTHTTPRAGANGSTAAASTVEPLSIKKKTSVRTSVGSPTLGRKVYTRHPPLSRTSTRVVSPRRVSSQIKKARAKPLLPSSTGEDESAERVMHVAQTTREDVSFLLRYSWIMLTVTIGRVISSCYQTDSTRIR
jgi:protein ECT2